MRSRFLLALSSLATASLLISSTALAQQSALDASGYNWAPGAYDFVAITSTGTALDMGSGSTNADGGEVDVTLPFTFPFYGNSYSVASVGVDGALAFKTNENIKGTNYGIPNGSSNAANVDIAVFWDDLVLPSTGGGVYTEHDTTNERFIISWEGVCRVDPWSSTDYCSASFQVHLYADGSIEFHYQDTDVGDSGYDFGASATAGIQDKTGGTSTSSTSENGLEVSRDDAVLLDSTAIAITICPDADQDGSFDSACGGDDCDDTPSCSDSTYTTEASCIAPGTCSASTFTDEASCVAASETWTADYTWNLTGALINPGAVEICADGIDQDCTGYDQLTDLDGDGDYHPACGGDDCDDLDASVNGILDADGDTHVSCDECDDTNADTYPGAVELCDGEDNDCDGTADDLDDTDGDGDTNCNGDCDDDDAEANTLDADGDSFDTCTGGDCDDANAAAYVGATEVCDSIDQDCDGAVDDIDDADGDGETVCAGDCDDTEATVNTSATEVCGDSIDNNCSGTADDVDDDADGHVTSDCGGGDCDDADAAVNPSAIETCDGADLDSDCDGLADAIDLSINLGAPFQGTLTENFEANGGGFLSMADSGSTAIWEYGVPTSGPGAANSGANVWATVLDGNYGVNYNDAYLTTPSYQLPATGAELSFWYWQDNESSCYWDYTKLQIDNGSGFALLDEGDSCSSGLAEASTWTQVTIDLSAYNGQAVTIRFWHDTEGGGSSYAGTYIDDFAITTLVPATDDADSDGYVDSCGDCNDSSGAPDASINPGATEICGDGIDNDCDGAELVTDDDNDGEYPEACGGADCDDTDDAINTAATEACDGIDNDCSGTLDDGETDADGDGSAACVDCDDADGTRSPGFFELCDDSIDNDCDATTTDIFDFDLDGALCTVDCDDADELSYPGAPDTCADGVDQDCNGTVDDMDDDSDGYVTSDCGGGDCDDADAAVNPSAPETCDGADLDSDCDGLADIMDLDVGVAISGGVITDVNISVDIDHTRNADVDIFLTSPTGTIVELSTDNGSNGQNFTNTEFDDEATNSITSISASTAPNTGSYQPEGSLSDFDGEHSSGTWTLSVTDDSLDSTPSTGVLNGWTLIIETASGTTSATSAPSAGSFNGYNSPLIDSIAFAITYDDVDGDGYVDSCGDCNDSNGAADASINPGATEVCGDGEDQDCDGADLVTDTDADGENCGPTADCNDDDAAVNTSATEVCDDATDNDCDGTTDFIDGDGDTYDSCNGGDCNDADANINPGATEVCEAFDSTTGAATGVTPVDTDCDGIADNQDSDLLDHTTLVPGTITEDFDTTDGGFLSAADSGDTALWEHGAPTSGPGAANSGANVWATVLDGNYGVSSNNAYLTTPSYQLPATGAELSFWYWQDNESYGSSPCQYNFTKLQIDDGSGFALLDDGDSCSSGLAEASSWTNVTIDLSAYAGQTVTIRFSHESDGSVSGYAGTYIDDFSITAPVPGGDDDTDGYVDSCGDCTDSSGAADATINPGATEVCGDGIDNDCDGADLVTDDDSDGEYPEACGGTDCDDDAATGAAVNAAATEVCGDSIDNDCNAATGDLWDTDGDGSNCADDCDDDDGTRAPGFFEWCNDTIDNDCDATTFDTGDQDGDSVDCLSDCDDSNPNIFPGAPEVLCTGLDEDCDTVDPANLDIGDGDSDSYNCDVDCDDSNAAVNPVATEIPCDGIDNDCDTEIDTDDGLDNDADDDLSTCDVDCNDEVAGPTNPTDPNFGVPGASQSPDRTEVCDDGIDNDCDPATDDIHDFDLDGALCTVDCDDDDALSYPGAPEICDDELDNDCDSTVDELADGAYDLDDDSSLLVGICSFSFPFCGTDWDSLWVQDNGRITFAADDRTSTESVSTLIAEAPQIAALWTDLNPALNGSIEVVETDSDSLEVTFTAIPQFGIAGTANSFTLTLHADGTASLTYGSLTVSDGLVGFACGGTAVDAVDFTDYEVLDGAYGIGSGTEDGLYEQFSHLGSPNDLANTNMDLCLTAGVDADGDGWTDTCGDCDDSAATTYPGADELCDSGDNDCNGTADDVDLDGDTYVDAACGGDDCDDSNEAVNSAATEICNGIDDDCDGTVETDGTDADGDGFLLCGDDADCDDTSADVNPDADEVCDAVDNDCNGETDEGFTTDLDADGYRNEACGGDDCDDTRASTYPDAEEVCDLVDNDCDTIVDEVDVDGDTFIDATCGGDDCDDTNADINPDAAEVPYDGIDNDCDSGDLQDADGDGFLDISVEGSDCDDSNPDVFPGTAEICDDDIDNDCDERLDKDDEECAGCSCEASISSGSSDSGASLLFALLVGAVASLRRRRA